MKSKLKEIKLYLEYLCVLFERSILNIFNVLPIRENRILFHSFNGRQYSCNPRAISEMLMKDECIEIIWAFNDIENLKRTIPSGIKIIKMSSFKYFYYAKTSKVIVCNARGKGNLSRRKNQIFIQTWHASNGYKKIDGDKGIRGKLSQLACKDFSYVHSGCENMTKERVRGTFRFNGPIIAGTPRMDAIINGNPKQFKKKVYQYYNIDTSKKIVLYAPTYRSSKQNEFGLDFFRLITSLEYKFGGEWILLVRMHYFVKNDISCNGKIVDATHYPDIQDLLLASDVLVSDYSSCVWDYSFLGRPCFLYCNDLSEYSLKVGFNHPIDSWGFPVATTNDELEDNIMNFKQEKFSNDMENHHIQMGSLEDGHSTERVCDIIRECLHV